MAKKNLAEFAEEVAAKEQEQIATEAAASSSDEAEPSTEHNEPIAAVETLSPVVKKEKASTKKVSTPSPEVPQEPKAFDYQEWVKDMPPQAKTEIEARMQYQLDSYIQSKYGDLKPLIDEIEKDPSLVKQLVQLSNKELRQFLFEYGVDAYNNIPVPEGSPSRQEIELQQKVQQYEARETEQAQLRERNDYLAYRDREFNALRNEFPELNDIGLATFFIRTADERSMIQRAKGNNVPVPIRDVYLEHKNIQQKRPNAPSVPATSASTGPQAPTDAVEVKSKILKDLKGKSLQEFMSLGKSY